MGDIRKPFTWLVVEGAKGQAASPRQGAAGARRPCHEYHVASTTCLVCSLGARGSQLGMMQALGGQGARSGDVSGCHIRERDTTGVWRVQTRKATRSPAIPRTAPTPKKDPVPKANQTSAENPWRGSRDGNENSKTCLVGSL